MLFAMAIAGLFAFVLTFIGIFLMKEAHINVRKETDASSYMHEQIITYREDRFLTSIILQKIKF